MTDVRTAQVYQVLTKETPQVWEGGVCLLTATHDQLENSPITAGSVSGIGWLTIVNGLKTLLETGEPLFAESPVPAG